MKKTLRRPRSRSFNSLEIHVASIFNEEEKGNDREKGKSTRKIARKLHVGSHFAMDDLFERLTCVSRAQGKIAISELRDGVKKRKIAASEISSRFSVSDEIESFPHLCVIVSLLEDGILVSQDLNSDVILERAAWENKNHGLCTCQGEQYGLRRFLRYLALRPENAGCHSTLERMISVLFLHKNNSASRAFRITDHYALADFVLRYLSSDFTDHGISQNHFETWLRRAVVPLYSENDQPLSEIAIQVSKYL